MSVRNLEARSFLLVVLLVTAAFLWIIWDLLMPVFWAAVLAVLFQPLNKRFLTGVKGKESLAAVLTLLTVVVVIIVPLGLLGTAVTQQALGIYRRIAAGEIDLQAPLNFLERTVPRLTETLTAYGIDVEGIRASIESAAMSASRYVATEALAFGRDALTFTIFFGLMLYVLFFFIRDGDRILAVLIRALPLGDVRERRMLTKFAEVSRATLKGTIVVAVVQGFVGGVTFALLGIEASIFWGVVMGVFALLPAIGPAIVWIPAAVILIALGAVWKAVIIVLVGTLVIGLVDNVLRPILVGRDTQMPDYIVLLSTFGGLAVFGISGVVVGPLIAALFLVVWSMFSEEYAEPVPVASEPDGDDASTSTPAPAAKPTFDPPPRSEAGDAAEQPPGAERA